jgi:hypothetical protein
MAGGEDGLPDVLESGGSGRWAAGGSRFLIVPVLIAGLVAATLAAVHYHAQAARLPRHPAHSPAVAAAEPPQVSSTTRALPAEGMLRGEVVMVTVSQMRSANAELLITAYISGGRPRTRYVLEGNDCVGNGADHSWASGVTDSRGTAVLTGHPWTGRRSDEYWALIEPSPKSSPPPGLHGSFMTGAAVAFRAEAPCVPV